MNARQRIALIHATTVAIEPILAAFTSGWPEAELVNILDDSLSADRAKNGALTPAMSNRIGALTTYAASLGSAGVLFTCSAFGPAIERCARTVDVPVLKPNEAMFEAAIRCGTRIGMLATFPPSVASMEEEFREEVARAGVSAEIRTVLVSEALVAIKVGDAETHNRLLAERVADLDGCDVIVLAHFSTSRARAAVSAVASVPVLTSPDAAVAKLKGVVAGS